MAIPVILDCDPGHDDAIALLLALASPEVEVLGVTTVSGNQTLEKTTANALRVLEFVGRSDVPVAAGANRPLMREQWAAAYVHGESGLDGPDLPAPTGGPLQQHAVEFLAERLDASARPVTLVPVGPLTNVALLLALHPGVEEKIERIVLMGGSIKEGNVTPAAEFNIWADPEAAVRVFTSGLDVTMIGLDVTHKAVLTPAHAKELRSGGRVSTLVADLLDFFMGTYRSVYGFDGAPIHDAVAVAHVVDPALVETLHTNVVVETCSDASRGRTLVDRWGRTENAPNAHVAIDVDVPRFRELLLDRLATLD